MTVGLLGLNGDEIGDTDHHGGPEQAVLVMGLSDIAHWSAWLGRPLNPGAFGENLTLDGLGTPDLALGDMISAGTARLQVTSARIPCVTLATRMGSPGLPKALLRSDRTGAYCRVLTQGTVEAGHAISHEPYDGDRVMVAEMAGAYAAGYPDAEMRRRLREGPGHAELRSLNP